MATVAPRNVQERASSHAADEVALRVRGTSAEILRAVSRP